MPKPALLALILTAALLAGCGASQPTATAPAATPTQTATPSPTSTVTPQPTETAQAIPDRTPASVVRVVDGDTIVVSIDGEEFTVRYIGIDTPETVHPSRPVEEFGQGASDRNKELVGGKQVWLEKDVSDTDRFGRLLRYVWLDETAMVNAILISEGLAQVSTFPPDVKYQELFSQFQAQARDNGVGLWSIEPTAAPTSTGECDPSYPGVCIPPAPPDLNCGDITERRFEVVPPDPHNFDTDGDGIGCES